MKLLSWIFAPVALASKTTYSPILLHFLRSNGFMSPHSNRCLNSQLGQILAEAQENTLFTIPKDSLDYPGRQFELNSTELMCFRKILNNVNTLNLHQAWFLSNHTSANSNVDKYDYHLYWAKKDVDFLLSIKPIKEKALNIVLQSFYGKVSKLLFEYSAIGTKVQCYSDQIMNAYKEVSPPPQLPVFDVKFATANPAAEPKVHYSLLTQMLRRKSIDTEFISSCKSRYYNMYREFLKKKGERPKTFNLNISQASDNYSDEVFGFIFDRWMQCWFLGTRIKRPMPSPSKSALGPVLVESFNIEVNALREIVKMTDGAERYYALEFSCTHVDYLIGSMHVALQNCNFLNAQHHEECIELICDHRILATSMIDNLNILHPPIPQMAKQPAANSH